MKLPINYTITTINYLEERGCTISENISYKENVLNIYRDFVETPIKNKSKNNHINVNYLNGLFRYIFKNFNIYELLKSTDSKDIKKSYTKENFANFIITTILDNEASFKGSCKSKDSEEEFDVVAMYNAGVDYFMENVNRLIGKNNVTVVRIDKENEFDLKMESIKCLRKSSDEFKSITYFTHCTNTTNNIIKFISQTQPDVIICEYDIKNMITCSNYKPNNKITIIVNI